MLLLTSCGVLSACGQNQQARSNHQTKVDHLNAVNRVQKHHYVNLKKPSTVNINRPSENKPYPHRLNKKTDQIVVSIAKQRTYLQHHGHTIYTMKSSTGSHNRTPRGVFHIQKERGNYFYSQPEHEGAKYYTSWKDHGVYLFHATPNNRHKQIIKPVAKQLGKRPSSHGCVHLTLPDAHYIETHAPVGLKVIIK